MSVLSLPSSAGIARMRWEQQRNDVMDGLQALRASDPLWRVSLELSPDLEANSGYLKALFMRLRGGVNQLELHDWARPVPVGTYRGTLTLASGVAAGATSMSIVAANDNLALQPEALNLSPWATNNASVSANAAVAPDGTLTTDKIVESTANGVHTVSQGFTGLTPGATYAISGHVAPAGRTKVQIGSWDGVTGIDRIYDLSAVSTSGAGASIIPAENGFRRCVCARTVAGTTLTFYFYVYGPSYTYAGDGSSGIYVWGAKLNAGAAATDYGHGKTLKKGDLLGIGSGTTQQVVMVTEDATSTSQGNMTVQFQPPLRNAFSAGQAVVWDKPKALFRGVSNELGWDYRGKNVITSGMAIDLIEDVRAA